LKDWAGLSAAAFSPDGKTLAVDGFAGGGIVLLYDAATGKELCRLAGHGGIAAIACSPDGGAGVGRFRPDAAAVGRRRTERRKCVGHGGVVARLLSDGRTVVSGGQDRTTRLWDTVTGEQRKVLADNLDVFSVSFAPDGRTPATGGRDRVRLWEMATGRLLLEMSETGNWTEAVCLAGRRTVASGITTGGAAVEAASGRSGGGSRGTAVGKSVAFSADGRRVVSGSWDTTALVWDATPSQSRGG
jgi:WD40 repeat protein